MMLQSILYVSVTNKDYSDKEIDKLLVQFRTNNKVHDITGMMLYYNRNVIQYIEGPHEKIYILFNNIVKDDRHYHVIKLHSESLENRQFPNWDMGYKRVDNLVLVKFMHDCLDIKKCNIKELFDAFLVVNNII
jgi:hypothetical protein